MLLTLPSEGPEREAQRREKQRIAGCEASKCVTHLKVWVIILAYMQVTRVRAIFLLLLHYIFKGK